MSEPKKPIGEYPAKGDARDAAHEAHKLGIEMVASLLPVPGLGALTNRALEHYKQPPLQGRRDEWFTSLGEAVVDLQKNHVPPPTISFERLSKRYRQLEYVHHIVVRAAGPYSIGRVHIEANDEHIRTISQTLSPGGTFPIGGKYSGGPKGGRFTLSLETPVEFLVFSRSSERPTLLVTPAS